MLTVCGGFEAEALPPAGTAFIEDLVELTPEGSFSATTVFDFEFNYSDYSDF